MGLPTIAPYEAAKENGTVALLSSGHIRLYNRIALQRELLRMAVDQWSVSTDAMDGFKKRFDTTPGSRVLGQSVAAADLDVLSPAELAEYQALIGTQLNELDVLIDRLKLFDIEGRAALDGVRDENELIQAVMRAESALSK